MSRWGDRAQPVDDGLGDQVVDDGPRPGIAAGAKRLGWNALDLGARFSGANLVDDNPLGRMASALGGEQSLSDYLRWREGPAQMEAQPDLGVMENYNPETGEIEYPFGGRSTAQVAGGMALKGAQQGAGFMFDAAMAGPRAIYNNTIAPLTGETPSPYFASGEALNAPMIESGVMPANLADLPEGQRPLGAAAETFGAAASGIPAMRAAQSVQQGRRAGRIIQGQGRPASPGAPGVPDPIRNFGGTGVQIGSSAGAAIGANLAERFYPGDPEARMGAEIIGSVLHPGAILARGMETGTGALDSVKRVLSSGQFDPRALENRAVVRSVTENLRRAGEDPEDVLRALSANSGEGFTTDVLSGSRGLRAMANHLRNNNSEFARIIDTQNQQAWELTLSAADRLATSNSPQALQQAAGIYRTAFDDVFKANVQAAETRARAAAARLGSDPAQQMRQAGVELQTAMDESWQAARAFENQVWRAVPKDVPLDAQNAANALRAVDSRVVSLDSVLPDDLRRFVRGVVQDGGQGSPPTSGEMMELYSGLRDAQRTLRASGSNDGARRIGEVANAIIEDLGQIPNSQAARTASREMHDVFSRTFAGDLLDVSAEGGVRIGGDTAAARAMGGGAGGTQRLQRADEIRAAGGYDPQASTAADFSGVPDLPPASVTATEAGSRLGATQEALEQSNRARMAGTVAPEGATGAGRVNADRLARQLSETQSADLPASQFLGQQALQTERGAQRAAQRATDAASRLDDPAQSALARVMQREGQDSTADIVRRTLARADSSEEYGRLARIANNRRLPDEVREAATKDLRDGTIADAMQRAGAANNAFGTDMRKARDILLGSRGNPGTLAMMERTGVISDAHAQRVRQLFTRAGEQMDTLSITAADVDVATPSALFDTLTRMAGAKAGGGVAREVFGGSDIQTPGAFAALFQRVLRGMPQYNPQRAMLHVLTDEAALETTLRAARAQGQRLTMGDVRNLRLTTTGMLQAGLIPKDEYDLIMVEIDEASRTGRDE